MARIFSSLAVVAVLLLVGAIGFGFRLGFSVGGYNAIVSEREQASQRLKQQQVAGDDDGAASTGQQIEEIEPRFRQAVGRATVHMLVGILGGIVAILVCSISVTYFIGTSRWCKEVVATYQLDESLAERSRQLKRRSFPWSFLGIVTVMAIVSLGGASDPATGLESTADWALPHFATALGGTAAIAFCFLRQASYIQQNSQLVEQIVLRVREIRQQRGLDVEL